MPVPPIYASPFGAPGLILQDNAVVPGAPEGTWPALLSACEACLLGAGARVVLIAGNVIPDGYDPLTLYLAKSRPEQRAAIGVRAATADDLPAISDASADSRRMLESLHPMFWQPHAEAATRFDAWMARSLTLEDRDMFVTAGG